MRISSSFDEFFECPSDGDQVADLVKESPILVPPEHERVKIDDLSPEAMRVRFDPTPQFLEGVEQGTFTPARSAREGV